MATWFSQVAISFGASVRGHWPSTTDQWLLTYGKNLGIETVEAILDEQGLADQRRYRRLLAKPK